MIASRVESAAADEEARADAATQIVAEAGSRLVSAPEPTDPEDLKIITLARSARARTRPPQGACVRDTDGRTYAATSVPCRT